MFNNSLLSPTRPRRAAEWFVIAFAIVLLLIGVAIFAGGVWLITLGGSWYYALAGIGLVASGTLMLFGSSVGVAVYLLTAALTWIWALWEVGLNGWPLVPRVVAPTILAVIALFCLPVLQRSGNGETRLHRENGSLGRPAHIAGMIALCLSAAIVLGLATTHVTAQNAAKPAAGPIPEESAHELNQGAATRESSPQAAAPGSPSTQMADARSAQPPLEAGEDWPVYGGSDHATRYSPLDQITPDNVGNLEKVWTFRTGDLPSEAAKGKYSPETTPIEVDGNLYLCSAKNVIFSVDAATGKEWWRYDPQVPDDAIPYGATCRGVAFYQNPDADTDELCATRIIEGTLDARLIAVDATSGQLCPDFGTKGMVDLHEGIGESVPGWYGNVAAPTIVRGIVVIGAQVLDGQAEDAPSGVIRGYDAVTGELAWAWDMCRPDLAGLPTKGETYTRGTPNMWTNAAGDEELGYVYVPLGNSAVDYYGGNRKACENEFSSALVAIDVTTGKPAWHFQTVHYDVWDYDLGSQPTVVDFPTDGGTIPAVVLPSKQGEIYVLDRRTGEPLFPVDERPAPSGGVEAENLSPTQPFSGYASLAKPPLHEKEMWGMSPLDQLWCRIQFRQAVYSGEYTPPTLNQRYVQYPGYNGGSDWGSVAIDAERGILVANYNDMPNFNRLLTREEAEKRGLVPINRPGEKHDDPQAGSPYAIDVNAGWRVPVTGLMCKQPPYGGIRAIDLASGKTLWDQPLGEARANGPFGLPSMLPIKIGTPNNGGAVVTGGGLIFIAAATDNLIRAIDIKTGKVLWTAELPAGGQANPISFESNGRQFIVVMAGGHHFMETPVGDYFVAYALPPDG